MTSHLTRIVTVVLIAALLSLTTAWVCAIWGPSAPGVEPGIRVAEGSSWPRPVPPDWPPPRFGGRSHGFTTSATVLSGRIDRDVASAAQRPYSYGQTVLQYGVPFRVLEIEYRMTIDPSRARRDDMLAGIAAPPWLRPTNPYFAVPLRPIWSGLALSTLAWSLALIVIALTTRMLRRAIRIARHRCPDCGYPVGVSTACSECGGPVMSQGTPIPCICLALAVTAFAGCQTPTGAPDREVDDDRLRSPTSALRLGLTVEEIQCAVAAASQSSTDHVGLLHHFTVAVDDGTAQCVSGATASSPPGTRT